MTLTNEMNDVTAIGIAGDWHGDKAWATRAIETFSIHGIKYVFHVGDFGFWPGNSGRKYLYRVEKKLSELDVYLLVTPGNHEDYIQLSAFHPHPTMEGFTYNPNYPHILVAKRGARWNWDGMSFVSLGGANSIDFPYRTENISWWKGERITLGDIYRTVEGGHADVMITHDCPAGVNIFGSHRDAGAGWSPTELSYAQQSRDMLRQAVDGVKPEILFHGHYHMPLNLTTEMNDGLVDYKVQTIGLDKEWTPNNMALFSLDDRSLVHVPMHRNVTGL